MNNELEDYLKGLESFLKTMENKLKGELVSIRSNRPSLELVEDIRVNYYGQQLSVKQLASLSIKPPREIEINVWDKNAAGAVMKAIESVNIGLTLAGEGNIIKAFLPVLTDERRQEFMKLAKKSAEGIRIQIRGRRDETIKKFKLLEEKKEIGEDEMFKVKERIQKIIDEANKKIDDLLENKLRELSE